MTDQHTAREVAALLAFTPAPSARRHDGWSLERQRRFIIALRSFGCVAKAARAVSASATGAYALRKRVGAESFAAAWDRALDAARMEQFEYLMERARTPKVTPLHWGGRFHSLRTGADNAAGLAALKLGDEIVAARAVRPPRS
jgi:hypothetical protein